jgi:hypothetical protein
MTTQEIDFVQLFGEIAATCDLAIHQAATPAEEKAMRRRSMKFREMQMRALDSEANRNLEILSAHSEMAASGLYD